MNIGLAITRCSIGYKVWAIDGGPIAEGPLSGAGASFCIQGWKTCQAGSVEDRVVVAPGDVFSCSIVPRIVVDIVRHVSVKADEDTAQRICHSGIAVYSGWTISVAARTEIASKTAQVLDDHPMGVSHSSCLVYPILIIIPKKCYIPIEIHRLVKRFPDYPFIAGTEIRQDCYPEIQPTPSNGTIRHIL